MVIFFRKLKHNCISLWRSASEKSEPIIPVFAINFFNILFDKKIFQGLNTRIYNRKAICAKDSLTIGIIGCHELFKKEKTIVNCFGDITVNGYASIGKGSRIHVSKGASFSIGNNTFITGRAFITIHNSLAIGDDCALSWNITIIDDDYHYIVKDDLRSEKSKPIVIGNKVWIGCNVTILKNVKIADGVIIAANSVVTKSIPEKNVLVAGNPAVIVRHNINWER